MYLHADSSGMSSTCLTHTWVKITVYHIVITSGFLQEKPVYHTVIKIKENEIKT
jgi:hypothetical protein